MSHRPRPRGRRGRFRFGWPWWLAIAAAVVVMVGGVVVVMTAFGVNANSPRVAVAAYLQSLKDGDASKALALDGREDGTVRHPAHR